MAERDQIDDVIDAFAPETPMLDLEIEGIVERINFLDHHLKRAMDETLADFGLTHGEWSVLGMLKRPGPSRSRPARVSASAGW